MIVSSCPRHFTMGVELRICPVFNKSQCCHNIYNSYRNSYSTYPSWRISRCCVNENNRQAGTCAARIRYLRRAAPSLRLRALTLAPLPPICGCHAYLWWSTWSEAKPASVLVPTAAILHLCTWELGSWGDVHVERVEERCAALWSSRPAEFPQCMWPMLAMAAESNKWNLAKLHGPVSFTN